MKNSHAYVLLRRYILAQRISLERPFSYIRGMKTFDRQGSRTIASILKRVPLHDSVKEQRELEFWLGQPPHKRLEAVTRLVEMALKKGEVLDRKAVKVIRNRDAER